LLAIRLSRVGKKRQPAFRIIVQEHSRSPKGKFIEKLGHYRPATDPKDFKVDLERVKYWLSVGARPSDAMAVLLKAEGVEGMEKFIEPRNKKRKKKKEEEVKEETQKKEAPAEEKPAEETAKEEAPAEEEPAEEPKKEESPKEEAPAEEKPAEEKPAEEEPPKEDDSK